MRTVLVRYLGPKTVKHVDLPVGVLSQSEITGIVTCDPIGEFPAEEAKKLMAVPGASKLFVYESDYQAAHKPKEAPKPAAKASKKTKGKKPEKTEPAGGSEGEGTDPEPNDAA